MALADFATVVRLRLRMHLLVPGGFRGLAKEAMLAEGRAFERCVATRVVSFVVVPRFSDVALVISAPHVS